VHSRASSHFESSTGAQPGDHHGCRGSARGRPGEAEARAPGGDRRGARGPDRWGNPRWRTQARCRSSGLSFAGTASARASEAALLGAGAGAITSQLGIATTVEPAEAVRRSVPYPAPGDTRCELDNLKALPSAFGHLARDV